MLPPVGGVTLNAVIIDARVSTSNVLIIFFVIHKCIYCSALLSTNFAFKELDIVPCVWFNILIRRSRPLLNQSELFLIWRFN